MATPNETYGPLRTHPKVLVPSVILTAAFLVGAAILSSVIERPVADFDLTPVIWGIGALGALAVLIPALYRWAFTTCTITPTQVVNKRGWIWTKQSQQRIDRVSTVDIERGLLDRVFGCGTIVLYHASDNAEPMRLVDIPRVEFYRQVLDDYAHQR